MTGTRREGLRIRILCQGGYTEILSGNEDDTEGNEDLMNRTTDKIRQELGVS